jgi:limonene-1,2-epoxide hydrolase
MSKESALASGCKSRADWLAALKQTDLAANGKRLFTAKTLFSNLFASAPQGVRFQSTLSRPDFVQMVKAHQAWIAKNSSGFYSWQHKVEKRSKKKSMPRIITAECCRSSAWSSRRS